MKESSSGLTETSPVNDWSRDWRCFAGSTGRYRVSCRRPGCSESRARAALQSLPFSYTSNPAGLIRLPEFTAVPAPSLVWSSRSSWRRGLSLLWNRQRLACQSEAGLLRIGVHPVDMQYPGVQQYMLKILHTLLVTRIPLTKQQWLAQRA